MAVRKTITVSITPEQDAFVRDRLRSGRFGSISEVIRAGLRLLERDETPANYVSETSQSTTHPE